MAVADVCGALTSDRGYRPVAVTHEEALATLQSPGPPERYVALLDRFRTAGGSSPTESG